VALERADEPDLLVDLHWTLIQCRMLAGLPAESLATLDVALTMPGISARQRARLLVLAARTHNYFGDAGKAGQVAAEALEVALEADDNWSVSWALSTMALLTSEQGQNTDALPLYERALTATQADPALTDLRLLLQINMALALGNLDRFEEALTMAGQARRLAGQVGTTLKLAQAHGALTQLFFQMGRWDDALAEMGIPQEDLQEPGAVCAELGIAAVISLHRGDNVAARHHLNAAIPHTRKIGQRSIGALAMARSFDREQAGELPEALTPLIGAFAGTDDLGEIEDLFADAVASPSPPAT
jgi:tetratricopeptide (TPR) repeat protein